MIKEDDFLHLNYTPDLTEAGISYALRHLAYPFREEGESALRRFQMMVVNKAVELAFRRYLSEQGIPSETVSGTSFGSMDEYQLILGGWHCDFESTWLGQPGLIRQVRSQPGSLLKAAALVPSERVVAWAPGEKGVCIFAFVIAQNPADHTHPHQAHSAEPVSYWLAVMPPTWAYFKHQAQLREIERQVVELFGGDLLEQLVEDVELTQIGVKRLCRRVQIEDMLRPVHFVPPTIKVDEMFNFFQTHNTRSTIVLGEFGEVLGIVTIKDVLKFIFGEITSPMRGIEDHERDEGGYIVPGDMRLLDFYNLTNIDITDPVMTTVGGVVFRLFGRLPKVGESVIHDAYSYTVLQVERLRIARLRVAPVEEGALEEEELAELIETQEALQDQEPPALEAAIEAAREPAPSSTPDAR